MKCSECHMLAYLQEVVAHAFIALDGRTRSIEARPVRVRSAGVREEVVLLGRPLLSLVVQSFGVTRGCGVDQVDLTAVSLLTSIHCPVNQSTPFYSGWSKKVLKEYNFTYLRMIIMS